MHPMVKSRLVEYIQILTLQLLNYELHIPEGSRLDIEFEIVTQNKFQNNIMANESKENQIC